MRSLFINGEKFLTTQAIRNVNPSDTADVVGEYAMAGIQETQDAIAAARAAFPAWAAATPQARHDILLRAGNEILDRRRELADLLAREEGKLLGEAEIEVVRAGHILQFFAGEAVRLKGETGASVRPGIYVDVTREPVGVIGLITPWNFPIAIPAWKIAPALAYGNTVVFKPAELVPGSAWELVDILHRAGLPPGVLNLLTGKGSVVGQAILDDPAVDAISFTGSQATGKRVAQASLAHMRRFQLEMGGKNPLLVLDDADLEIAVECALDGSFYSTGQRCTASSRLIVTNSIHDRFVEMLAERMRRLVVGDARKPGTGMGPVVDENQLRQDTDYIEVARRQGGTLRTGGERLRRETPGYYLSPALITNTTNDMRINREEVFGPVASVIRVRDYEEGLSVANDTEFGLCAGICTTSLKYASDFKQKSEAGMVMVNLPTAGVDHHVPFGGRKGSSFGPREQGAHAREFFTEIKTSYTRP